MQPFIRLNETILSALMLTLLSPCLVHAQGGTVWTWGQNKYGQLGDGTTNNRGIPAQVPGLSNVIAIAGSPSGNFV